MGQLDGDMKILVPNLVGKFQYNRTADNLVSTVLVPIALAQAETVSEYVSVRRKYQGNIFAPTTVPNGLIVARQGATVFGKLTNRSIR